MSDPTRELRAEILIDAPVERVWQVVTDTKALSAASPELIAMTPLKHGGFRAGQQYIGWNRRKLVPWTTRNVVVDFQPHRRLEWRTTTSGAHWVFELSPEGDGTHLVQRRPIPGRPTAVGKVFAAALLGGGKSHADELQDALSTTLAKLKELAEQG
ncbi:MAG: SRPBCC family protein [Nocardioidaceae bacterium]|nr:SRPBCC family protein [Nocardioidaceae bacterium]MCL2613405.1 SRPBCC family protein [Nocardioidaceae bacterium]